MTVLVVSVAFPVNASADNIITIVDLTAQETLALYGSTISAVYYTSDNTWAQCTYSYVGTVTQPTIEDYDLRGGYPAGFSSWSDYMTNAVQNRTYLAYVCSDSDALPTNNSNAQLILTQSVDISGISYYRQNFLFGRWNVSPYNAIDAQYCASTVSYSPTPIISYYAGGWDYYAYGDIQVSQWVDDVGFYPRNPVRYQLIDVYLQNLVDGVEQEFSISEQSIHLGRSASYALPPAYDTDDKYYVILVQCPRVTDSYIIPQPETTAPNYSGQLSDIYDGIGANTTLLQAILAKLDLIYQQMQNSGLPSPTLTPAQTIPPTLQQYYTGIASGAPSVSAVNSAIGGASDFIPLGAILSSSGLGSLLGVLAGLCCAGWVLTRGRSG